MRGLVSFIDGNTYEAGFWWINGGAEEVACFLQTVGASAGDAYTPAHNSPFSVAGRYAPTAINGALDGTALTELSFASDFPSLSGVDMSFAFGNAALTITRFSLLEYLGNSGIKQASQ